MKYRHRTIQLLAIAALCCAVPVLAQPFSATAQVEENEVFVGSPFHLSIRVQGTREAFDVDFSRLTDFDPPPAGAQPGMSMSQRGYNGRVLTVITLTYQLTPKRAGTLTIPALTVTQDGKQTQTRPIRVEAKQPEKSDHVKLRVSLSRKECYVGEAIHAEWTLYFSANLSGLSISIPALEDPRFTIPEFSPDITPANQRQYRRLPVGGTEVLAIQKQATLDGKQYATLSFERILIPRVAGDLEFSPCSAAGQIVVRRQRTNDFFNPIRNVVRQFAIRSNAPTLTVKPMPTAGRPANFAGHVGHYQITTIANPTNVNVGDPINLTIILEGPEYVDNVQCPDLTTQDSLTDGFRVSQNSEPGEVKDGRKVFRRIIRATHPDVTQIPPIELPYLDSSKGTYEVARSREIPLEVRATKVVTAQDAEGTTPAAPVVGKARTRSQGLAANYEDASVLRNQQAGIQAWLASPSWLATLAGMPLAYLLLAVSVGVHRRRHADPHAVLARKALRLCRQALDQAAGSDDPHERVLAAIRAFCGAKFGLTAGALTYEDVAPKLQESAVPDEECDQLCQLFTHCEAGRYAGAASVPADQLVTDARDIVRRLDKCIQQ